MSDRTVYLVVDADGEPWAYSEHHDNAVVATVEVDFLGNGPATIEEVPESEARALFEDDPNA